MRARVSNGCSVCGRQTAGLGRHHTMSDHLSQHQVLPDLHMWRFLEFSGDLTLLMALLINLRKFQLLMEFWLFRLGKIYFECSFLLQGAIFCDLLD